MDLTRRNALLGLGATVGLAVGGGDAFADDALQASQASVSAFDTRALAYLKRSRKVFVGPYRFGVVVRGGAFASTIGGTATSQTTVSLAGVNTAMLQAIASKADADLRAVVASAGRELGDPAALAGNAEFAKASASPQPFAKSPAADARLVVQVAPQGQPLILTHSDSPITDKSPFDLANARALSRTSADLGAIVLTPQVVIDFAQVGGSGVTGFGGAASTSVKPGLFLVPQMTAIMTWAAKQKVAPDGSRANLNKRILLGNAGAFVKTSDYNNAADIADWNSSAIMGTNTGNRGPDAFSITTYKYVVDPAAFDEVCSAGVQIYNRILGDAMKQFAP